MHMLRNKYRKTRQAAVTLQKHYRNKQLTKLHRNTFIEKRNSVIYLQSKTRYMIARRKYLKQKSACIIIQSFARMCIFRTRYNKILRATSVIQKHLKNYQISKEVRNRYLSVRKACIIIQSYYRMHQCRKMYIRNRLAVISIQRKYRATHAAKEMRQKYVLQRNSCIKLQSFVRMVLVMKKFSKMRKASTLIQSQYRCYAAKRKYGILRRAAIMIQKYFVAWKTAKTVRRDFLVLKSSAITIQSAVRGYYARKLFKQKIRACIKMQAFIRMCLCRKASLEKRRAIMILQKHIRAYILAKKIRTEFVHTKKCIVIAQAVTRGFLTRCYLKKLHRSATKIQAVYRTYALRRDYIKQKESAIVIQRHFRSVRFTNKIQKEYMQMRYSAIAIQSVYRKYVARKNFLELKAATILLQSHIRRFIVQKKVNKLKRSVCVIENHYLAYIIGTRECQWYQMKRRSCIKIQALWRGHILRKKLRAQSEAAVKIQRTFRLWKERKVLSQKDHPTALTQHEWYVFLRRSTIRFQRAARAYILKREKAATVIQSYFRMWREHKKFTKLKAAIKIQACWRAYLVRRSITDKNVLSVRKKIKAADSTEAKKLKNRATLSLAILCKNTSVQTILFALQELDVCTKLSSKCCERLVASGGLTFLLELVNQCNRSLPHMEIIKVFANVLLNLAKNEKTVDFVWEANGSIPTVLNLMKIFRQKGTDIFTKCCSLLWIFSLDPEKAEVMKQDHVFVEQIRSFHNLLTRKQSIEEKRTSKAIAAKSLNKQATSKKNMSSTCPKESLKIDPDWMLGNHRRREFKDPIVALTCVMESLDIQGKDVKT